MQTNLFRSLSRNNRQRSRRNSLHYRCPQRCMCRRFDRSSDRTQLSMNIRSSGDGECHQKLTYFAIYSRVSIEASAAV